jgi:hypothetical protein
LEVGLGVFIRIAASFLYSFALNGALDTGCNRLFALAFSKASSRVDVILDVGESTVPSQSLRDTVAGEETLTSIDSLLLRGLLVKFRGDALGDVGVDLSEKTG